MNTLPCPAKILVIAMRFLGDVLLTTPLIHSLKLGFPNAEIDVLVFTNTATMLEGNPDIHRVITVPVRARLKDHCQVYRLVFRHYDLVVNTQTGDRPFLYALLAAPLRIGIVPEKNTTGWWKRFFYFNWVEHDELGFHTVLQNLKLLESLNISPCYKLIPPVLKNSVALKELCPFLTDNTRYIVLHPHPQWTYKRWTLTGWIEIGQYLESKGIKLVLSGGASAMDLDYVAGIADKLPTNTINLVGKVSLAELTVIIAGACLYIGPDTGITHLAAATGIPVIAIYGPTNPVKWSPWPFAYNQTINPFNIVGNQHVNNVHLIQGKGDCVPCQQEGCDRHLQSRSLCLDNLPAKEVISVIATMLGFNE